MRKEISKETFDKVSTNLTETSSTLKEITHQQPMLLLVIIMILGELRKELFNENIEEEK